MKATELRIGNWVLVRTKPTQVENIHEDYINLYYTCGDYEGGSGMDYYDEMDIIHPIPLNEDILLKSGFSRHRNSNAYWTFWVLKDNWSINEVNHTEPSAGVKESKFYWSDSYVEFEYLHQLQNLYFVITGKELEINL